MSLGISFGSIGDLIAVGEIAWSLAKALSNSRGSVKEYQGLVKELQTFNKALLQIVALWQNYDTSPELYELGEITKAAVKDCRNILLAFRLKFEKKYGTSLEAKGSGYWIKDASKKVLWLKEKDDVLELRRKIQSAGDTIGLLVLTAMGKSNKLDYAAQTYRVQAVHCLLQESMRLAEEQISHLKGLDEKANAQAQCSELILSKVTSGIASLTQVRSIVIDMKSLLDTFKAQIFIQQAAPRGLGTHWRQEPVTLEDALGNIVPIPLELVNSWDMFETILTKRFEKLPGRSKVLRKEYAIEESRSGREFSHEKEWNMCFRPGQKVDMSMVFKQNRASTLCPGCQTESKSTSTSATACENCGMWFRRIEELTGPPQRPNLPPMLHIQVATSPMNQPITPELTEDDVSDFKRVRLLFRKNRAKNYIHFIKFKDAIGRKYEFPFHLCQTWPGIAELIRQAFLHVKVIGPHIIEGCYDLIGPNGEIILPQVWETVIEPGWSITMHMWPLPDNIRPSPRQDRSADKDVLPLNEISDTSSTTRLVYLTDPGFKYLEGVAHG